MHTDARTLPEDQILESEICIVGAGAAGITLAREFAGAQFRVILLESGGLSFRHRTQHLYRAENRGRPYPALEFTRRRQFGGSTVTWFGRCRPLDEIDFEARAWLPYSGWPFSKPYLDPFYSRAGTYCQLGPGSFETDSDYFRSDEIETKNFLFSPPTDFAQAYRGDLERAGNVHLLLNTNATHIQLDPDGSRVVHIVCRTLSGKSLRVRARVFLLAASALENTRLMLSARDVHPDGIGNQHDLLGRFFMEHPHIFSGAVTAFPPDFPGAFLKLDYDLKQMHLGSVHAVGLTRAAMERDRLLNGGAFFVRRPDYKTVDAYFEHAAEDLLTVTETLQHARPPSLAVFPSLIRLLRNARWSLGLLRTAVRGRRSRRRWHTLRLQLETAPNPDSRVSLSARTDALGLPQLSLEWRTTDLDVESMRRFEERLYRGLERAGLQTRRFKHDLAGDGWPVTMRSAKHHMGTTRMHPDPRRGVVDADCRVHSVSNLYVAGSSVFPTSGMANPTLTIVALAIRLADHIRKGLGG